MGVQSEIGLSPQTFGRGIPVLCLSDLIKGFPRDPWTKSNGAADVSRPPHCSEQRVLSRRLQPRWCISIDSPHVLRSSRRQKRRRRTELRVPLRLWRPESHLGQQLLLPLQLPLPLLRRLEGLLLLLLLQLESTLLRGNRGRHITLVAGTSEWELRSPPSRSCSESYVLAKPTDSIPLIAQSHSLSVAMDKKECLHWFFFCNIRRSGARWSNGGLLFGAR